MADIFDAVGYFKQMAEDVTIISNAEGGNHFTQVSNLEKLEGFLAEMQGLKGPQIVLMDTLRGRFINSRSDNYLNQRHITFFLLLHMQDANFQGKDSVMQDVKYIGDQIIARMLYHRRNYLHNMHLLDPSTITFDQVGPIGSNWFGLNYSFFMFDYPGNIEYNADNYNN
jgi:hypothetical protein